MKFEHQLFLRTEVIPKLRRGGSVSILGLTSRTGTTSHNQVLSEKRANGTLAFLRQEVPTSFAAKQVIGVGELQAAAEGLRNRTEHPRFRSVIVFVSDGPTPPEPPKVVDLTPDRSFGKLDPSDDPLDMASKVTDVASGVLGLVELVPWQAVSEIAGSLGGLLGVGTNIFQMPLLWKGVRDQNTTNGRAEGYWDAVQEMANAFSDPGLATIPEARWPTIPRPTPRPFTAAELAQVNQREWMEGRREGCKTAYEIYTTMDRDPTRTKDGRARSGRLQLFQLRTALGSEGVREWVKGQINKRWISKGVGSWPLRK